MPGPTFVQGHGWISLDPTHESAQTDHYVRVAIGRTTPTPPTRGVYKGAGREAMEVDVRVEKG